MYDHESCAFAETVLTNFIIDLEHIRVVNAPSADEHVQLDRIMLLNDLPVAWFELEHGFGSLLVHGFWLGPRFKPGLTVKQCAQVIADVYCQGDVLNLDTTAIINGSIGSMDFGFEHVTRLVEVGWETMFQYFRFHVYDTRMRRKDDVFDDDDDECNLNRFDQTVMDQLLDLKMPVIESTPPVSLSERNACRFLKGCPFLVEYCESRVPMYYDDGSGYQDKQSMDASLRSLVADALSGDSPRRKKPKPSS